MLQGMETSNFRPPLLTECNMHRSVQLVSLIPGEIVVVNRDHGIALGGILVLFRCGRIPSLGNGVGVTHIPGQNVTGQL